MVVKRNLSCQKEAATYMVIPILISNWYELFFEDQAAKWQIDWNNY